MVAWLKIERAKYHDSINTTDYAQLQLRRALRSHGHSRHRSDDLVESRSWAVDHPNAQGDINNTNSGNVGVGTATPTANYKLDVTGPQIINYGGDTVSSLFINATGGNGVPAFKVQVPATGQQKAFQLINAGGASGWASFEFNVGGTGKAGLALGGGSATRDTTFFRDGVGLLRTGGSFIVDGNIGIGTTSPTKKLHMVSGTDTNTSFLFMDTGVHGGTYFDVGGTANNESYLNMNVYRAGTYTTRFGVSASGHLFLQPGASGNVGVGTSTPGYKLDIQGGQLNTSGGLCIAGDCKTAWSQVGGASQWSTSGSNIYYNSGSAGIGTTTPNKSSASSAVTVNGSSTAIYELAIGDVRKGNMYHDGTTLSVYNNANGALTLGTNSTERFRIDAAGNVGIGTAPTAKRLEVSGDLNASGTITGGTIQAKYQDVAEWVESSQLLSAGTVVVLDQTKSNQVIASSQAYDTRVAGVIPPNLVSRWVKEETAKSWLQPPEE
jgi:hypothetical protein